MKTARPTYKIVLVANAGEVDAVSRLKQLLKVALRRFGFRCIDIRQVPSEGEARNDTSGI